MWEGGEREERRGKRDESRDGEIFEKEISSTH